MNHDGENYKFYYVYFGDIVELACKNAGLRALNLINPEELGNDISQYGSVQTSDSSSPSAPDTEPPFPKTTYYGYGNKKGDLNKAAGPDYGLNDIRVLLGPVEYRDPLTGKIKIINLSQFPISFNYFRSWFLKKIIRKNQPTMTLGNFLMACMNNLIIPAMGSGMPKSIKTAKTKANMVSLTLPGKQTDEGTMSICGRTVGRSEEMLPLHRSIDLDGPAFKSQYLDKLSGGESAESMVKTSRDYLLIYVTTSAALAKRVGDPVTDLKDGIYHFNIGSDRGLLKTMSFERVQLKNVAEMRYKQAQEGGIDSLAQLKFPYNTGLSLFGTPLFVPGMFYYVNPSMAGLGSVEDSRSLAYQMNLGGYHVVLNVKSSITPGGYETSVTGKQVQQGKPR